MNPNVFFNGVDGGVENGLILSSFSNHEINNNTPSSSSSSRRDSEKLDLNVESSSCSDATIRTSTIGTTTITATTTTTDTKMTIEKKNTNNQRIYLPSTFQPNPYSVIIGRGKESKDCIGNRRLKVLASNYLIPYSNAINNKAEKSKIVSRLVRMVHEACKPLGGGAFIKLETDGSGRWYEASDAVAREKVGYTFRELLGDQYRSSSKSKVARKKHEQTTKQQQQQRQDSSTSASSSSSSSFCDSGLLLDTTKNNNNMPVALLANFTIAPQSSSSSSSTTPFKEGDDGVGDYCSSSLYHHHQLPTLPLMYDGLVSDELSNNTNHTSSRRSLCKEVFDVISSLEFDADDDINMNDISEEFYEDFEFSNPFD